MYFIGIDVGTRSARAALISSSGKVIKKHAAPITVHNPKENFYEQSTAEIWDAVCECVREVVNDVADKNDIKGIGFDATCSLAVVGEDGKGLSVDENGDSPWDVIMWMDHRATRETDEINTVPKHFALFFLGGSMSVEMEMPKLMWLKRNRPATWRKAKHFFDLPDFLTWKASGSARRSICSLICKWTYLMETGYSADFLEKYGLEDLVENDFERIGSLVLQPGTRSGHLTEEAAAKMNLHPGIPIGTSLIDAHSGVLGLLAYQSDFPIENRLTTICGTSSCHFTFNQKLLQVEGVWGPYHEVILPGYYVHEGGQSTVGSLIDHVIQSHPAYAELSRMDRSPYEVLEESLEEQRKKRKLARVDLLTRDIHVLTDYHGNRTPRQDPNMKGMISGLTLDSRVDNLALIYLATIQGLSYGAKDIVLRLRRDGHDIKEATICGGLSQSRLFIQTHANALQIPFVRPAESESVLLGAAMLGAAASGEFGDPDKPLDYKAIVSAMGCGGEVFHPEVDVADYHNAKHKITGLMVDHQEIYNECMENFTFV